jgi:hypothetical protein
VLRAISIDEKIIDHERASLAFGESTNVKSLKNSIDNETKIIDNVAANSTRG